ncbi:hypothetical protein RN001_000722 [Aquatica leii]|uniref:Chitin-binding type-2 domain-containing protein n=1 Tax=Aquatica leii TaxID=1421715 RepID=A0AAN7PMN4_9COLE|nr:hypothetical protein RN001_000722 [Aquatica leii]
MKFIIVVYLTCLYSLSYAQSNKTITISAPNCNFNMTVQVPTTKCCCPNPPTVPPTVPTTLPPSGPNFIGCVQSRVYNAPTCYVENSQTFPGTDCDYYFICKKVKNKYYAESQKCPKSYTYSIQQMECVPKTNTKCCVD